MRNQIEEDHAKMVAALVKDPQVILDAMTPHDAALIHSAMGVAGEAGELIDAVKKSVIYRIPLDAENVVEELGDLEFYMEDFRRRIGVTREMTLQANIGKLAKRYADFKYTDQRAKDRADKTTAETIMAAGTPNV